MKKLLLGFVLLCNITFAHSIPNEILEFLAEHPDATQAELDTYIAELELEESLETWDGTDNPETFSLPPQLVQFLLDNPEANEPEILTFIESDAELSQTDWRNKIGELLAGYEDPNQAQFTLNDLALLNQLGSTFDEVYSSDLNWWQFAKNYVILGVEHILEGLDHILFVMSLVLLLPTWRRMFHMVTAFTLAHSVTLILGGTNILTISAKIVEPLIAASIAYLAITTVFLSKKYPWFAQAHASLGVIFLFGLFHGLGFAGVFADVAPQVDRLLPSLLFFNVGVEIGQLMILAVFVPFLWSLKHFKIDKYFTPLFAICISALALWWMVVRIFF